MTWLMLDTSAYAAFMRGLESANDAFRHADKICVNPIVLGELKAVGQVIVDYLDA